MASAKSIKFFAAVSCGNRKEAKRLLDKGVNPNFLCDSCNRRTYPLLTAVKHNDLGMVRMLLNYGANDCGSKLPLHHAFDHQQYAILTLLLDATGAPVGHLTSLLYLYCRMELSKVNDTICYREIGHLLLENGADPFVVSNLDGTFPLWVAAEKGNYVAVEVLVRHCKRTNRLEELIHQCKSNTLSTPLYIACQNGHLLVAEHLLRCGADVNASTHYGSYPLYISAGRGYCRIVELLLLYGANCSNKYGPTCSSAVRYAYENHHQDVGDLLTAVNDAREHAHFYDMDYFMHRIETDNLPPFPRQWLPFLDPREASVLIDWVYDRIRESIVSGSLPIGQERFIELLGKRSTDFVAWLQECLLLEKVCASPTFQTMYNPIPNEVASYLLYPKKETWRLIDRLSREFTPQRLSRKALEKKGGNSVILNLW